MNNSIVMKIEKNKPAHNVVAASTELPAG